MKPLSCILLCAALSCSLFAFDGEEGVLVPREVFPGDEAIFTVPVPSFTDKLAGTSERILSVEPDLVHPDITISAVRLSLDPAGSSSGSAILSISFIPWASGELPLPPIHFEGLVFQPSSVTVLSLLDRTGIRDLQPVRPPVLVPGTVWRLYGGIALALLGIILSVTAIRVARASRTVKGDSRRAARRIKKLASDLKRLEKKIAGEDILLWYLRLSTLVRSYLECVCGRDAGSFKPLVTSEIIERVHEVCGAEDRRLKPGFESILQRIDQARFSGREPTLAQADEIGAVRTASRFLEEILLERRNADAELH